jgi:hypothetical protein
MASDYWIGRSDNSSEDHAVPAGRPIGAKVQGLCGQQVSVVMGSFRPGSGECDECSRVARGR